MADDQPQPPKPRPRRRRTDIDPNAPSPPVANERRRRKKPTAKAASDGAPLAAAALADAVIDGESQPDEGTRAFHVPGMAAVAAAAATTGGRDPASPDASGGSRRGAYGGSEDMSDDAPDGGADFDDGLTAGDATMVAARQASPTWLAMLDDRSPDPNVCPFLRAAGETGLTAPIETSAPANRCAALAEAVPQSLRQQELVCLTTNHVNCPRYLRGAAVLTETPTPVVREGRAMSPAMLGSLIVLVIAVTASVAFVLARGGALTIGPLGSPAASVPVAVASTSPSAPVASPSVIAQATPTPSPSPSPTPSATPTPTPSPTARPTRTPRPTPSSDRYQLLRACANTARCWIYTVRRGDNLYSIANYFGVSQDSIYARNPWLRETGLRAGQELRLPPPTR